MATVEQPLNPNQNISGQPLPDWSSLPPELVEAILKKLPYVDVLRFKSVCSSWSSVVKYYVSSPTFISHVHQTPWLLLPKKRDELELYYPNYNSFYNLSEKKVYKTKNVDDGGGVHGYRCVGSSLGWLVCLDKRRKPYIINPFSGAKINLPSSRNPYSFGEDDDDFFSLFTYLIKISVCKAILTGDPVRSKSFEAVVINGFTSSLTYWKNGDCNWTEVGGSCVCYYDIIYHQNLLYAMTMDGSVEIWDLKSDSPRRMADLNPPILVDEEAVERFPVSKFTTRWYVVEAEGDVLVVSRFVGNFVDRNGNVLAKEDLMEDEYSRPSKCPYRTMDFRVHKLDSSEQKWVGVESLGGGILFLGGNNSAWVGGNRVSEGEGDLIYFTDDDQHQFDSMGSYGGNDMGVYSMKDGSIKPFYPSQALKINPPPFFVFPSPC